jgi:hypothetical protein
MAQHKLVVEAVRYKYGYTFSTADDEIIDGSWGGEVLSQSDIDTAVDEYLVPEAAKRKLLDLEGQITPRRMRDHALGTGGDWLSNQEALIAVEREKL